MICPVGRICDFFSPHVLLNYESSTFDETKYVLELSQCILKTIVSRKQLFNVQDWILSQLIINDVSGACAALFMLNIFFKLN